MSFKNRLGYFLLLVFGSLVLILYVTDVTIEWSNLPKILPWDYRTGSPPSVEIHHLSVPHWLKSCTSTNLTIPPLRARYPEAFEYMDVGTLPTSASKSYFEIINRQSRYSLCDKISVKIVAKDETNKIKSSGGDYFFANLYDFDSRASSPADGDIVDHGNGRYTVEFTLRWVGTVKVTIFLVHTSEAINALRRVRDNFPARQIFIGKFISNKQTIKTFCHVTPYMYMDYVENASAVVEFCNFTDPDTGSPWYCIKPTGFPCSAYREHSQTEKGGVPILHLMNSRERELFEKPVRLSSLVSNVFRVKSKGPKTSSCLAEELPQCIMGKTQQPKVPTSGFYFKESWTSLKCKITHFSIADVTRCLANRVVYFLGDSTIRQWFTYLAEKFDNTKFGNRFLYNANYRMGDDVWRSRRHNITMHYHHHGFPNRIKWVNTTDIHYLANMIDELPARLGSVVFISIAAHFTITNLEFYRARLSTIKQAINKLVLRNPNIPVFIKTANTRDMDLIDESNWYLNQLNRVLKEEMAGIDVTLLDVWDLTSSHWTMFHVHPSEEILENEIDLALSYLCPKTKQ